MLSLDISGLFDIAYISGLAREREHCLCLPLCASDSPATYGALEMCFSFDLIFWILNTIQYNTIQ